MNPILLSFADGTSFFIGLAITFIANFFILHYPTGPIRIALSLLVLTGIAVVVISATPLPAWAYALWLAAITVALVSSHIVGIPLSYRRALAILVAVITIVFGFSEWRFQRVPHITVPGGTTVYVIGDSISAGIGNEQKCWPTVFSEMTSLPVVNLAKPGATVQTAITQANSIKETNATVILEIGGNDIIGGTDAGVFQNQLLMLVSSLRLHQHRVLMLELPLFPFQNAIGVAQRSVAAKYDVLLLPKRCFATVLGMRNGTLDGLHLSQSGHNALAGIMAGVVEKK